MNSNEMTESVNEIGHLILMGIDSAQDKYDKQVGGGNNTFETVEKKNTLATSRIQSEALFRPIFYECDKFYLLKCQFHFTTWF